MDDIYFSTDEQELQHPFYQKNLVFTGGLSTMTRSEAAKRVRQFEVTLLGKVTPETDFVILGDKHRGISSKHRQALYYIDLGYNIQLIEEDDFLWLLSIE